MPELDQQKPEIVNSQPATLTPSAESSQTSEIERRLEAAFMLIDEADSLAAVEGESILEDSSDDKLSPELTVVIPVYNEPKTVVDIVRRVRDLPITKQIVVVNDGSTDGTANSLQALIGLSDVEVIHHDVNRGKGAALQTGFRQARGEFVIVQDADLEYDPQDILKVIDPLQAGDCDVVYGSRYLENAKQDPSWLHRLGNWGLTTFSNMFTGYRLTDMETCYKAFRRDVLQTLDIEQSRFGFEPEITAKLARRNVAIREVGVSYRCRSREEGKKIGIKDLFNAVYCIVRYRF